MDDRTPAEQLEAFMALARDVAASPAPVPDGEWGIDLVLAHVAANNSLIALAVAGAINGGPREYWNDAALEEVYLRSMVAAAGGVEALLAEAERSGRALNGMLESDDPRLDTEIHVHLRDGDTVLVDAPRTCRDLIAANGRTHLRLHRGQLEAMRAAPADAR